LALALLSVIGIVDYASAIESVDAEYERYYPQYVDSKEPLTTIKLKDIRELKKAKQNLQSQSIPSPITMRYGNLPMQQLDIYRVSGEFRNPVIFFIHEGSGDKTAVIYAVPPWLSLGYTVVSINYRSVPDNTFPEMVEDGAGPQILDNVLSYRSDQKERR
jgi:acetyl esterase/lipase